MNSRDLGSMGFELGPDVHGILSHPLHHRRYFKPFQFILVLFVLSISRHESDDFCKTGWSFLDGQTKGDGGAPVIAEKRGANQSQL